MSGDDDDWPSRSNVCRMFGNTMHVNIAGLVLLFAWSQVEMDSDVLQFMHNMHSRFALNRVLKRKRCEM